MDALDGADALAIVTEWGEFRRPNFKEMRQRMTVAGDLRRPESLQPRRDASRRLHLPLHRQNARRAQTSGRLIGELAI